MKRHNHWIGTQKLDKAVHPWWTPSPGPTLKCLGSFINSAKEFGKIHKYTSFWNQAVEIMLRSENIHHH
jgi:hypothetical protein